MDSKTLACYIESTHSTAKPWLLVQLRLIKLREMRQELSAEAYEAALEDIHHDLMNLGEWWQGIEKQVF